MVRNPGSYEATVRAGPSARLTLPIALDFMTTSVLIPSYQRPAQLMRCIESLRRQTVMPSEVIIVWQGQDEPTRDICEHSRSEWLKVVHCPSVGIVPAENAALRAASGEIVLLIDDDAVAPGRWLERHLVHYQDPTVGAIGGPADNFHPNGDPFPRRAVRPVGRLSWYGKLHGNMYDQNLAWRTNALEEVHHLVGYNLSFRRIALETFEAELLPYWQMFELDACLTIRSAGYRILFDYSNVVDHHPTNTAYEGGRQGDLAIKIYHGAYNHAFVLAKHSRGLQLAARMIYLLLAGSVGSPGMAAAALAVARYGRPVRELKILWNTWVHRIRGWRAGVKRRGVNTQGSRLLADSHA
jgi:glycosyltransferase involved in cell wall biosynthesis